MSDDDSDENDASKSLTSSASSSSDDDGAKNTRRFSSLNIGESVGGGANGEGVLPLLAADFLKLNSAEDGVCGSSSSFASSSRSIVAFFVFFFFPAVRAFRAEVFMTSLFLFSSVNACEMSSHVEITRY